MSFSEENGYTPTSIEDLMDLVRLEINEEFNTTYTSENFVGTGFYRVYYALIQKLQENEVKTSEIFAKLQLYIPTINAMISRPVTSAPGLVDKLAAEGYLASVKQATEGEAGQTHVCVDVDENADDYAATKLDICTILSQSVIAGNPTFGTESEAIVLSNGQSFDFKYHLPTRIPIILNLIVPVSENNQFVIDSPENTALKLFSNINERYKLGMNFEPQKYFDIDDAPWSSGITLRYSVDDGENWLTSVFDADFDEVLTFGLEDIEVTES